MSIASRLDDPHIDAVDHRLSDPTTDAAPRRRRISTFAAGLIVGLALLGVSLFTYAALMTPLNIGERAIQALYYVIILLFIVLLTMTVLRGLALHRARRRGDAGARLHVKLVFFFGAVALIPALFASIFAAFQLERGLDVWFSRTIDDLVAVSQDVVVTFDQEQKHQLAFQAQLMARWLDGLMRGSESPSLRIDSAFLANQALLRQVDVIVLLNAEGDVLAKGQGNPSIDDVPLPDAQTLAQASTTATHFKTPSSNLIGTLLRLNDDPDKILYFLRVLNPRLINGLSVLDAAAAGYRNVNEQRNDIEVSFARTYVGLSLIFLLLAVWIGLNIAGKLATPIQSLIGAARRVAGGDLSATVKPPASDADLATLCRTFNAMIGDISQQRDALMTANDRLEQRRRLMEAVLAGVTTGIVGLDDNHNITLANRTALESLGADPKFAYDAPLPKLIPQIEPLLEQAEHLGVGVVRGQIAIRNRNGASRILDFRIGRGADRLEGARYVAAFDDVTDFLAAQRLSTWRDIARRVAHEIKNPLTPIQLAAERLRRRYGSHIEDEDGAFSQCVQTILRQVKDIGRMIDEFSSFARMPKAIMRDENLISLIDEAAFSQRIATPEIVVETSRPDAIAPFRCDRRQIAQCLINLLKNAAQAIERRVGANPDFKTRQGFIALTLEDRDGSVAVSVADNGVGLPRFNRDKLTEPYVTHRAGGSGLGLALVLKIVQDHGGSLELDDRVGKADAPLDDDRDRNGTIVRIELPRRAEISAGRRPRAKEDDRRAEAATP